MHNFYTRQTISFDKSTSKWCYRATDGKTWPVCKGVLKLLTKPTKAQQEATANSVAVQAGVKAHDEQEHNNYGWAEHAELIVPEVFVYGELAGRKCSGYIDRVALLADGTVLLADTKFTNKPAKICTPQQNPLYGMQLACYAALFAQMYGNRTSGGAILWVDAQEQTKLKARSDLAKPELAGFYRLAIGTIKELWS